jgi:eukaryotic-like serine/threonine-protein kinase
MPTTLGQFEILSELAKSPTSTVYKANDPESGQTIALKAIQLSVFGDSSSELAQALMAEAESTKVLSSPNITSVNAAGEIEGQFCAAMEYVQGNSIATMLARKEGFTIWDLLDIGRQLCAGLDHAKSHNVVHYSLEPAKIMCGWDGTVKLLSYGISSVGKFAHLVPDGVPSCLYYMSPEQVRGEEMDSRSNLFSLGAMFYEMVTERKAFDRDDVESLRQSIVDSTPVAPIHVNPKIHPLLSDLIMKALAKDPAERYQTGRELLDDLEKCKESKTLGPKKEAPKGAAAPAQAKGATQAKSAVPAAVATRPAVPAKVAEKKPAPAPRVAAAPVTAKSTLAAPKAAAAAAGVGGNYTSASAASAPTSSEPEIDLSDSFVSASVKATLAASERSMSMSSATLDEPQVETFEPPSENDRPKIAVDPMMAEGGPATSKGVSFSEMTELPPLKEAYVPPPPPTAPASSYQPVDGGPAASTMYDGDLKADRQKKDDEKKVQPREVAEKAIKEIKNVPPKLMGYALGAAGVAILIIGIGVTYYVHTLNSDDDSGTGRATVEAPAQSQDQPAPQQPVAHAAPQSAPAATPAPEASEPAPEAAAPTRAEHARAPKKKSAPVAPVVIPGQMAIDSTPQGAQVVVDGMKDPSYVTPFALTNLQPGQHSITVSKVGYGTDSRSINVVSGNRATVVVHLAQLMATLVVNSDPAGANIYVDGRDTGTKTPAQVSVDKGTHVVLVRKMGYIDETMNAQFVLGQTFNFAPSLRPLGNADSIKTVGKMSKLFGGKGAQPGQATLSIHTQPKGAQVAINQHIMDKNSPLDVALDPGNYVIDITLTGYAPLHKVITADKGGKVVIDETLAPQ